MKNLKKILSVLFVFSCIIYILLFPAHIAYHTKHALSLCANALIPSLFLYIFLSCILSHIIYPSKKLPFCTLLSRFFSLPQLLIPSVILGLFTGAPSGAVGICELYGMGCCSKRQAEKAVVLASNCSASFIIGVAGAMLGSTKTALLILISNILSVITVYMIFFKDKELTDFEPSNLSENTQSLSVILSSSLNKSVKTVLTLCGYVIVFYTFSSVTGERLLFFLKSMGISADTALSLRALYSSLLEMTSGVTGSSVLGHNLKALTICFATSFTGISIILQVKSVLDQKGLSSSKFIQSKILASLLSPIYLLLMLIFLPRSITVSGSVALPLNTGFGLKDLLCLCVMTAICFIGAAFLSAVDKNNKKR